MSEKSKSISASSSYWDGKQIELTPTTKKNIEKKAFVLDAEAMTGAQEPQATETLIARGVTQETLAATEGTYSNIALKAIELLEANTSQDSRIQAINALQKLGYTNIYENISDNFITPPEFEDKRKQREAEAEVAAAAAEDREPSWKSNPYFNRGAKQEKAISQAKKVAWETAQRIKEQNRRVLQMQETENQMFAQQKAAQKSQFIQSMTPRVAGGVVRRNEMTSYRPPSRPVVTPYANRSAALQQVQQPQVIDPNREAVRKYGLNPAIVNRFAGKLGRQQPTQQPPRGGVLLTGKPKPNQNVMSKLSFGLKKRR